MFEKALLYLKNRQKEIFGTIGLLAIVALAGYLIYQLLRIITTIPGFSFDPLMAIAVVFTGYILLSILSKQNKILENQQNLLEKQTQLLTKVMAEKSESRALTVRKPVSKKTK